MADTATLGNKLEEDSQTASSATPEQATEKPDRKKQIGLAFAVLLAVVVIWQGFQWWTVGRFEESTDNAYIRANISLIAPRVQGYVAEIYVEDNQVVKAGDVLFSIEAADYQTRVSEAEASLAQAEAAAVQARANLSSQQAVLVRAKAELTAQNSHLKEAGAAVDAAKAKSEQVSSDYDRNAKLAEGGYYPKARLSDAASEVRASNAELERAEAARVSQNSQLALAKASIQRAQEDVTAAEAAILGADSNVAAAKARLEAAHLNLQRTRVRAPVDGVVGNKTVAVGQFLNPGQQAMAVVPMSDAFVIANFKETQVARMKPGQEVELHIDAYPKLHAVGRIESLAPTSGAQFSLIPQDTATGNFTKIVQRVPVHIEISEETLATGLMRPGLSVEAVVKVNSGEG